MNPSNDPKQLLAFLPTPSTPRGLEGKVLRAVHKTQQKELTIQRRLRQVLVLGLVLLFSASSAHLVISLAQNGFQTVAETIMNNADVLPLRSSILALLETIPFDQLALTVSLTFLVCLVLYRHESPKPTKHRPSLSLSRI